MREMLAKPYQNHRFSQISSLLGLPGLHGQEAQATQNQPPGCLGKQAQRPVQGLQGNVSKTIAKAPFFANLKPHLPPWAAWAGGPGSPKSAAWQLGQASSKAGARFARKCKQNHSKSTVFRKSQASFASLGCMGRRPKQPKISCLLAWASKLRGRCKVCKEI